MGGLHSTPAEEFLPAPIKMFIKDEPHKLSKILDGRLRLISCLALEDQLLDRVIFYPWTQSEIRNFEKISSKVGWAPFPNGFRDVMYEFSEDTALAIDKTAWDWTLPEWVVYAYIRVKLYQCKNVTPQYALVVISRILEVLGEGTKIRLPSGKELVQDFVGFMKSGWSLTISMNSMAQELQHNLALIRIGVLQTQKLWAMGDDSLINWSIDKNLVDLYIDKLKETGCLVKHYKFKREFAGFDFSGSVESPVILPLYVDKHKYQLRFLKPELTNGTMLSYTLIYALAGNCWLVNFNHKMSVPLTDMQRSWAMGMVDLKIKIDYPEFLLDYIHHV